MNVLTWTFCFGTVTQSPSLWVGKVEGTMNKDLLDLQLESQPRLAVETSVDLQALTQRTG